MGDDGLMSQSKFDVNIKEDDYLAKLCPDPHLFISSMPSDDQLKKQYSKLLKGVIMLKQKISRGKTLSAVRRRGELMDLKIADISAKDVILDIDDAEFLDWCTNNSYARLWHCSQVNKSAILQLAIKNTILRSPHPELVNFFDECYDFQVQFVGFVTAQIEQDVVTGLHIHSCALYYTHGGDSKTTIVICAITSRIHILSMMQDRVFQLVQLLQYDVTRGYSITLTNQFIGTDVILNDTSMSGYESMGFNTKSMMQDVEQGQFTITVDNPIPLMPYSDRFTWAKYGHHILYSGIIPTNDSVAEVDIANQTNGYPLVATHDINLTATHRECLILFLQTDPGNAASFCVDASINQKINDFLNNILRSFTKGKDKGNFFDQICEKNMKSVALSIGKIAKEATKIPFAIFTNLFHYRFKKKSYLESTLELLQQFYIQLDELCVDYRLFVGDLHKYCLHCTRCHCAITRPDFICQILEIAPMAMLWHLGMASDICDFPHCPVILPSEDFAYYSHAFFEGSMEDMNDNESSPFLKCNSIKSQGMLTFCEASKVDLQSYINSKKNEDTSHNSSMVNTISLLSSMFSDVMNLNVAVESGFRQSWSEMKCTEISGPDSVIWNIGQTKKKKGFMREHSLYNPIHDSNFNFDQLRLYEGWCAFFHNEHTKNLLCVLEAIARNVYGPNNTIPDRYLKVFSLDHEDIKSLVERRAENKSSTKLYRFNLCSHDSEDMIIGEGIGSRPLQLSLGKLHTMTSIIEKQGLLDSFRKDYG